VNIDFFLIAVNCIYMVVMLKKYLKFILKLFQGTVHFNMKFKEWHQEGSKKGSKSR